MSRGKVLLYNLKDTGKRMGVKLCLFRLGISCRDVPPEDFGHPLGYLLAQPGFAPAAAEEGFDDEMMVLYDLPSALLNSLLDALRVARVPVALKAVVTEHNISWSSARLHRELAAEHEAMSRKLKKPIHH